jgi:hypothetical protein
VSELSGDRIETASVSRDVVETAPIVLRESPTRRLVFLPALVAHEHPLRGSFVYQRKRTGEGWEDVRGESFNSLRSGEGWCLELHAEEVSMLMNGLQSRKALYERYGIQWGTREYVDKNSLPELVQSLIDSPESDLAEVLGSLQPEQVVALGRKVDLSQLDALLSEWLANAERANEDFWHDLLARHAWVFSQLTGSPVVLLREKAYVSGKGIENTGGGEVDFLVRNALTDNVAFVEIKTPATPICAGSYRTSGSFALDKEMSGGIVQVLGYRDRFDKAFYDLRANSSSGRFQSYNSRCVLIAGKAADLSEGESRSFELFRNSLFDVQVWTFDEVAARLQGIRDVLALPADSDTLA